MNKEEAKLKVIEKGGVIRDSISNDLWYLVTNNLDVKSKKFKKARELGVTFIDELEFLKMIE
jgi:DNA ligase (NAD+)